VSTGHQENVIEAEIGTVSDRAIEAVNKEIEMKDSEKLDKLQASIQESFRTEISNIKNEYNAQIEQLKKQLEEKDTVINSYDKRFEDFNSKLEELAPRKGLAKTEDETPYQEISQEESIKNAESVINKPDIKQQIEIIRNLRNIDRQKDYDAAQSFLESLK